MKKILFIIVFTGASVYGLFSQNKSNETNDRMKPVTTKANTQNAKLETPRTVQPFDRFKPVEAKPITSVNPQQQTKPATLVLDRMKPVEKK